MSEATAYRYEPIVVSDQSTVVAEFTPDYASDSSYQSEAQLELEFIALLNSQAYETLRITSEADLVANLRTQLEALNDISFSNTEWQRFFTTKIASANDGIEEKTVRIHEDSIQLLERDDGSTKNIKLIDKTDIHNNHLHVLNQYEIEGRYKNRYDVTILVNGLPLVHIELKRRGVDIREAFNQIERYQRDSFWAGSGLFEYVQLFVISNGTLTKYYSNTTRRQHIEEANGKRRTRKSSNSFEFTSWWADAKNRQINDLVGFTKTFFAKHTLLRLLTRYCVLTVDRTLLVMRPYQIAATEVILSRITVSTNYKQLGTLAAGGYIWHTTGSGKTLTSFKTAQLATGLPGIDKVLFVVDRKDLDYQTMREYERFEKGAANSNTSTAVLKRQLENPHARIIITTIQKLSRFVTQNKQHPIFQQHVVLIFDECHRSQFGDMHGEITRTFKQYHLFGFTGTPIFAENSGAQGNPRFRTTEQAFGQRLHTYTIVDAITDKNVLPFRIDYVNTVKTPEHLQDKKVSGIEREKALLDARRLIQVVDYMLDHFDQKTKRNSTYLLKEKRLAGFNSIFATASIDAAKRYYAVFKQAHQKRKAENPSYQPLKIATIFTYAANEEEEGGLLADEGFETDSLDQNSRDFLESAISDYNTIFKTNFDTSAEKFENYYKDVSRRVKERELDLLIVVNMFLTGFDATTLNTLWVDKQLRQHGLIQAFSRTNRILNSVKTYGNIVTFRDLDEETNDALALFGNKDAAGIVLLRPYHEYLEEYENQVAELKLMFPLFSLPSSGEATQKAFIQLYGAILRQRNILTAFDDFDGNELLSDRALQDYRSIYLDFYNQYRKIGTSDKESINDDIVFEIELIKQVEVNVDYILMLVEKYLTSKGGLKNKEIAAKQEIERAVDSSVSLRNKKDLILAFVDSVNVTTNTQDEWKRFVAARRDEELERIITEENLKPDQTREFVRNAFRDGAIQESGTAITTILPPTSRFSKTANHSIKKQTVLEKLKTFFDRFFGLISSE
jgi:type I restriction enzyme R subunit